MHEGLRRTTAAQSLAVLWQQRRLHTLQCPKGLCSAAATAAPPQQQRPAAQLQHGSTNLDCHSAAGLFATSEPLFCLTLLCSGPCGSHDAVWMCFHAPYCLLSCAHCTFTAICFVRTPRRPRGRADRHCTLPQPLLRACPRYALVQLARRRPLSPPPPRSAGTHMGSTGHR